MLAVWAGAIGGVALAIVIGIIFIVIFYVAQQTVFQGSGKNIFTGVLMLIASFMITFLAFAMLKIRGYEEKWQAKLEGAATQMVCSRPMPMHARHFSVTPSSVQAREPPMAILRGTRLMHLGLLNFGQLGIDCQAGVRGGHCIAVSTFVGQRLQLASGLFRCIGMIRLYRRVCAEATTKACMLWCGRFRHAECWSRCEERGVLLVAMIADAPRCCCRKAGGHLVGGRSSCSPSPQP